MANTHKIVLPLLVFAWSTTACNPKSIMSVKAEDGIKLSIENSESNNRYEIAKVRETSGQLELYILDKKTGLVCYSISKYKVGENDFGGCLPNRFE